ncbi:MAG: hypothetical protein IT569_00725 [Leptospiraceae bacterium]|nr:hypothetical protein [Leptospiraceae bacterium]
MKEFKSILMPSIVLGVLAGVFIVLISYPFNKFIPELQSSAISIPLWKTFLASIYGGITEQSLAFWSLSTKLQVNGFLL